MNETTEELSCDGIQVISSSSDRPRRIEKLIESSNNDINIKSYLRGFRKKFKCGHRSKKALLDVYGVEVRTDKAYCPDCLIEYLKKEVIRCCSCRLPIFPDGPVALYSSGPIFKDIGTRISEDGPYMGCLRWDCCPSGGFFSGHWNGKEFVPMDWENRF